MNPNYYRSASPQPQSAAAASQRDHGQRAMYQNPYGTAHDIAQIRTLQQMGSPFGFSPSHPHPGATQFFQGSPANYHMVAEMNQNAVRELQQQQQQQRSVSPARRRPSMMSDFHADRERYLRTISPTENRSPSGSTQRHIQRPPSPRHSSTSNASGSRYEARETSSSSSSHDRHSSSQGSSSKKLRLSETTHYESSSQDVYSRGENVVKQEARQQEYISRPMPLEAISPPANDETNEVDRMLMQVQEEIRMQNRNMVDSEMTLHQWEAELKAVETRKEEYDKAQRSHAQLAKPDSPAADVTGDGVRRIISENRRISEAEHKSGSKKLHLTVPVPTIVSNPMDLSDVMQVLRDYHKQRPGIILRLKKDRQAKQIRERYLKERYKQLSQAYVTRMEKIENNPKKKNREAKMREYYERQFPEIKKIREDKIRDGRAGVGRKGDEMDGSGTMNGSDESEMEKYHRNAVLVPMLLDAKDRSRHFYDRNRLIENCANEYKLSITNCFWTQEEKDTFKEKYLQRPKDFGYICSFLKRKSVQDCVQHYYLTKRMEMYKQMIKKQKAYRIRRGPNKQRLQSTDDGGSPTKLGPSLPITSSLMRFSSISDSRGDIDDIRAVSLTALTVCPAKKCHARRRSIKRLFKAPVDVPNYTEACRQLELPDTAVSCCKYCVSYMERRLGLKKWTSVEVETLKKGLINHGANWTLISKSITTKRLRDCVQYYRRHITELGPVAGDASSPPIADDEYSPFSVSSSSDGDAPRNGRNHIAAGKRTETVVMVRTVSEDSNATLSADEVEDEPEPPIRRFMTSMPRQSGSSQSFAPNQLPICESSRSHLTSPYARSPESRIGPNGPACVRDLIHSAIEKNLDKDRQTNLPHHVPDDFRRRLEATVSNIGTRQQERNLYSDLSDESHRGMSLLTPRNTSGRDPKSPSSPGRRDLSPSNPDDRNRLNSIRSPTSQPPQAYQYSTRQNLLTDFATSRQIHAEQHAGDVRPQFEGQPANIDPRFMQFYSPYVYLPQGYAPMQLTPEYMESLAAAGYGGQMAMANAAGSGASTQGRGTIPAQQRSIILGTGRPGASEAGAESGESSNRLQTLAAARGILRETGPGDKRKPDVITIDDARREGHSPAQTDMRFHPASHHMMKSEMMSDREPNPMAVKMAEWNNRMAHDSERVSFPTAVSTDLTAGSLIDVIITRQISNTAREQQQQMPSLPSTPSAGQSRPTLLPKREIPDMRDAAGHKPFTLGEHIEQIIASDFSRKDTLAAGAGGGPFPAMNMVSGYQQFARMDESNWKRNRLLRMEETANNSTLAPSSYSKPSTSSTVEYEPISPAASREASESGDDDDRDKPAVNEK